MYAISADQNSQCGTQRDTNDDDNANDHRGLRGGICGLCVSLVFPSIWPRLYIYTSSSSSSSNLHDLYHAYGESKRTVPTQKCTLALSQENLAIHQKWIKWNWITATFRANAHPVFVGRVSDRFEWSPPWSRHTHIHIECINANSQLQRIWPIRWWWWWWLLLCANGRLETQFLLG